MREGLDVWRCKQQQLLAKKAHEQKQLREMLLTYSPWGRPGGGAPNADTIRKRKALQLETLYGASAPPPSTSPGAAPYSTSPTAPAAAGLHSLHNGNLAGNLHGSGCQTLPRLSTRQAQAGQAQQTRRLRSDPLLLFQFQEADRRAVDNLLRYRTDPRQQEQYRRELVPLTGYSAMPNVGHHHGSDKDGEYESDLLNQSVEPAQRSATH
ncbi:Centrosome and spindle pole associated protein 1 [Frankliniella fusca]|uniref:Centrosome and spindle pole associated protein 1 n=1 Tax=Frankliniella fusca TaxID=407009 RepID=A0AAE1HW42_9NEOP|nr:Centrosome and spindle pole associated protein 1 [Frankliniella fusca]